MIKRLALALCLITGAAWGQTIFTPPPVTFTGTLTPNDCANWNTSTGTLGDAGAACGSGTGTVSTTDSPANGNLTKFSGATSITNGDLSGDCTTAGALAITCTKTGGNLFGYFATGTSAANLTGTVPPSSMPLGLTATPAAGAILVGNAGGTLYASVAVTGDCTAASTGAWTCLKTNGVSFGTAATVNTGTSGATLGLLNGNLTFGGSNAYGTPSSITLTNGTALPLTGLATQLGNTVLVNATAGSATPTAQGIGSCSSTSSALNYTTNAGFGCQGSLQARSVAPISGHLMIATAGTTIASGFGSSPTIATNGSSAGAVTVGSSPGTTGVLTLTAATNGWACQASDLTTNTEVVSETATSTTSATFTFYSRTTGTALAPTASDVVAFTCLGY